MESGIPDAQVLLKEARDRDVLRLGRLPHSYPVAACALKDHGGWMNPRKDGKKPTSRLQSSYYEIHWNRELPPERFAKKARILNKAITLTQDELDRKFLGMAAEDVVTHVSSTTGPGNQCVGAFRTKTLTGVVKDAGTVNVGPRSTLQDAAIVAIDLALARSPEAREHVFILEDSKTAGILNRGTPVTAVWRTLKTNDLIRKGKVKVYAVEEPGLEFEGLFDRLQETPQNPDGPASHGWLTTEVAKRKEKRRVDHFDTIAPSFYRDAGIKWKSNQAESATKNRAIAGQIIAL
ncbi:hypothetical protein AOQ84DRAFT_381977 [Glonium stellatum]|uniref:Uncharacterized protein n=1 Tax=Glonium stellatum TaxID=574774 RepID=A0A8E2JN15_9PEZI|nr:hypothetical protein AOQ84DRAFT_381977 [Glonium stellatum]